MKKGNKVFYISQVCKKKIMYPVIVEKENYKKGDFNYTDVIFEGLTTSTQVLSSMLHVIDEKA